MMLSALFRLASFFGLALCVWPVQAQFPGWPTSPLTPAPLLEQGGDRQASEQPRANQRILPLPSGQPSVLQQIELLERLNSLAVDDRPSESQLSESQLKMLDRVMNSFRNEAGELELPNLDMLPPDLLGNLLSDPVQRQQARRLLEQYARERNLGLPGTKPNLPQLPLGSSRGPASEQSNRSAPGANNRAPGIRPSVADQGKDQTGGQRNSRGNSQRSGQVESPGQGTAAEPSEQRSATPNPNQLRAIEDLVKNLRMIDQEQQKSANSATNKKPTGSTAGRSGTPRATAPRQSRPSRPVPSSQAQNSQRSSRLQPPVDANGGQRYPGMSSIPNTFPPMPEVDESPNALSSERDRLSASNNDATNESGTSELSPNDRSFKLDVDEADRADPFRERRDAPANTGSSENPFADGTSPNRSSNSTAPRGFRVKELAERLRPSSAGEVGGAAGGKSTLGENSSASARNATAPNANTASNNLVQSLRGLVNKALKEQGHDERSASQLLRDTTRGLIPGTAQSNTNTTGDQNPGDSGLALQPNPTSSGPRTGRDQANRDQANGNGSSLNQNATSASGAPVVSAAWRSLVQDVWRSITTAPEISGSTIPPSKTWGNSTPSLPDLWNVRVASVLVLAALALAILYWLASRRQTSAQASSDLHERWAREVLTYGVKTRADVVRAFHLLVMQTSHPVAEWWNHRHATRQLAAASPQIGTALNELAVVYEQARYTPPDIPLHKDQLERVRLALQHCQRS